MARLSWNPSNWLASVLLVCSPVAPPPDVAKPGVVLVHGIYDTGKKMEWLAHRFQRAGYETFCPSLEPADGSISLEDSASQLDAMVARYFGGQRPLHVVGFSKGGLITRYWLAHFPVRERVLSFATISTPHHGTSTASFIRLPGIIEMRPTSEFLKKLEQQDALFAKLHPLSLYTPLDLMIVPANSSKWAAATNEIHWSPLHPLMVFSPKVADRLLQNMLSAEALAR